MNEVFKKIIGWILYIAILIGLIYGIPRGLAYILKTDYPIAAITSGSMWPALKKGDLVLIKGVDSREDVKVGDIVVYDNKIGFSIHRIVQIKGNTVVTKGDANNVSDPPIESQNIIGKALSFSNNKPFRIPLLGNISILINKSRL